jgi:hypothetical protein
MVNRCSYLCLAGTTGTYANGLPYAPIGLGEKRHTVISMYYEAGRVSLEPRTPVFESKDSIIIADSNENSQNHHDSEAPSYHG